MVILGVFVFIYGNFYGKSDKVLSHKSDDKGNGNGYEKNNGSDDDEVDNDSQNDSSLPNYIQPTLDITISPTLVVMPSMVVPTIQTTISPVAEPVAPAENTNSSVETQYQETPADDSDDEQVVVVPVSERSVVSTVTINSNTRVVVPTKSIFKKIENKIKGVGGGSGQFLSRPKSTTAPTPTKKTDDLSPPVALGPDSSIFYMLTDTDLILGAVDKEDKRINVDEVELRGAEITMDKVLKKKGLDLGVSSNGDLVLTENGVRSYFDLPVFVDVFSHDISVDTVGGKKQIETTPARAVVHAIESGYLENVDRKAQMTMEVINGDELVYKLQGDKEFKVLGGFGTKGVQYVYVNVETGDVTEGDQPLLSKVLKLISL